VAGYPRSPAVLAIHGGSVNNKCFTKSTKKLSMNKSDETYCLRSLLQFGVINSQYFSFIYFRAVFFVQIFLNVQKSLGGHTQKFCNFAVIEGNQMPLGIFMGV